jgi:diacylglycerol O-acyltransferase / wax synthase
MSVRAGSDRPQVDNTLAFMDQASYLWVRASGHVHCIQLTWVYRREVDRDALGRMRDNLAYGLLGRRVEPSPLPGGRHRWVACHDRPGIDVSPPAPDPSALADWFDERAHTPIDPEFGPAWHLGVLPIPDYGTAVSLVASHTVVDGLGLALAVRDAVNGVRHDFGYPPPGSRRRRQALAEDVRATARALPEVGRALGGMMKVAMQNRPSIGNKAHPSSPAKPRSRDLPVTVPTAAVYVDLADWDACADRLGGTSNVLLAGFAAKLAERFGRRRAGDNLVTLSYPVNDRTENDLRANALKGIDFPINPVDVTTDLRATRQHIKQALADGLGKFADQERVFPLTPFVPKVVVRKLPLGALNAADLPVGCSNCGELDPAVARADGTDADFFSLRTVEQNLTEKSPELINGELYVASGRVAGKIFLTLRAYQPGAEITRQGLQQLAARTLADFGLTGHIE